MSRLGGILLFLWGCGPGSVEQPLGDLKVQVEAEPMRIVLLAADGSAVLEGLAGGHVGPHEAPLVAAAFRTTQVEWQELFGSFDADESYSDWQGVTRLDAVEVQGGAVTFRFAGGSGRVSSDRPGVIDLSIEHAAQNRATMAFRCAPGEHFAGFGAQTADVDQRGQSVPLWVSEQGVGKVDDDLQEGDWFFRGARHQSYFPMPFFVSSRGYGVELDTDGRALFTLCSERDDAWRVEAWEGTLHLRIFVAATPLDVIRRRAVINEGTPRPPAWTFAPWNDAILGSTSVRQVAKTLRDNHIPSSVIWTEDWAGGTFSGDNYGLDYDWAVDRTLYPDAEALASELHGQGFKWLAYFNTFVEEDSDHYAEGEANGWLIKKNGQPYLLDSARFAKTSLVDLSNPAAAEWMAGAMRAALALGFDGWMADYGEWLPVDAELSSGVSGERAHNRYPVEWQQLNQHVLGDDQLSFVRSGWLGSQKIGHQVVWGGDQLTEFDARDGLPTVPVLGITLGLSGMPFFGSDIGGYTTPPSHAYSTKELFFRWTTVGALSPIMRTHHGTAPLREWRFDADADTLAHYGRWARLHQKLFPYLERAAAEASATGVPMMRGLMLAYPDDDAVWSLRDEWLLGPSLLVAPVLTEGAIARDVYLPAGRWLPLLGGAPLDGGQVVRVEAPLTEIPVFVPPGTELDLLGDEVESLTGNLPAPAEKWRYLDGEPASLTWNGAPLLACGQPPCGAIDAAAREARLELVGGGALTAGDSQLTIPAAVRTVVLRW